MGRSGESKNYAAVSQSCSAMKIHWFWTEEERRCLRNLLRELNIKSLLSAFPPGQRHVSSTAVPKYGLPPLQIWTSTSRQEGIKGAKGNLSAQRERWEPTWATVRAEIDRQTHSLSEKYHNKSKKSIQNNIHPRRSKPDWISYLIHRRRKKKIKINLLINFDES